MKNILLFMCLLGLAAPANASEIDVLFETNFGDIGIDLYPEQAPVTVDNFTGYVEEGFYDGLIFHRVIDDFVIQAGAYDADLNKHEPTSDPIVNESYNGLSNTRGTIAMARTLDPDSATSQFYINKVDNIFLDYVSPSNPGYCVFGEVVSGMDVVDAIAQVPTHSTNGMDDVPDEPVIIEKATVIPEPATILLLGLGSIVFGRKRRKFST
ncbi:MAG: peptidyl-prolyl cis-trans isomerase [Planctomycetota bacterium]|nr:MAG: peptidyl-prolyl cis-trans isomerase [Planctomycetota bacterium]